LGGFLSKLALPLLLVEIVTAVLGCAIAAPP
jgi:hypothetical protein